MQADTFEKRTAELLQTLRADGVYKALRYLTGPMDAAVQMEGEGEAICLCSNNYLGLANHPEVVEAAHDGLRRYGAGTASVRFICGTFDCHRQLEERIASFVGTDAALSYVSCWNANEAAIATVVGKKDDKGRTFSKVFKQDLSPPRIAEDVRGDGESHHKGTLSGTPASGPSRVGADAFRTRMRGFKADPAHGWIS